MNEYDFTESMMQAMADKLAAKILPVMTESIDQQLGPMKHEIRRADRLATAALIAAGVDTVAVIGVVILSALSII